MRQILASKETLVTLGWLANCGQKGTIFTSLQKKSLGTLDSKCVRFKAGRSGAERRLQIHDSFFILFQKKNSLYLFILLLKYSEFAVLCWFQV